MLQRSIVLAILGIQLISILVALPIIVTRFPAYIPATLLSIAGSAALMIAYYRGWDPARYVALLMTVLFIGLGNPEPFVSQQASITVFWPPVFALIVGSPWSVVISACATIGILILRAGGGNYADPLFLALYAMLVGGLVISRWAFASALHHAEAATRSAEDQARELHNQQQLLQERERRYRLLVENTNDIIVQFDRDGRVIGIGSQIETQLGYSLDSLMGGSAFDPIHPDDLATVQAAWDHVWQHKTANATYRFRMANGDWRWFEARMTLIEEGGRETVFVIAIDVTEQRSLAEQLQQAQKMEGIGRLAGGIAHDFNNLLTVMHGYTELVLAELPEDSAVAQDLRELLSTQERAANLTRQLLAFARNQVIAPQLLDLSALINDMARMLERLIGEDIEMRIHHQPDLAPVYADPGQIEQVVVNLIVNARDAMPRGGRLLIETSNATLSEDYTRTHADVAVGRYVMTAVSDTGVGIPDDIKPHLFEPFFTTKGPGQGTGLGLATCYGIIKQNKGFIYIYSERGVGTTVKFYLPDATGQDNNPPASTTPAVQLHGSERIMVVEDEPILRELVERVLASYGYTTLIAANGVAALQMLEQQDECPVDLLLTDVVMPQLGGQLLVDRIKARWPQLKILYTSGYTDQAVLEHGRLTSNIDFLAKPFTPLELAQRIRTVLDH
jgi:PAS domain S-box-containing protein